MFGHKKILNELNSLRTKIGDEQKWALNHLKGIHYQLQAQTEILKQLQDNLVQLDNLKNLKNLEALNDLDSIKRSLELLGRDYDRLNDTITEFIEGSSVDIGEIKDP